VEVAINDILYARGYSIPWIEEKISGILADCDYRKAIDSLCSLCLQSLRAFPLNLLIKKIRLRPFSVVLLDEIEKASPEVFDALT